MALFGFCAPILAHTILVMTITRPGHKGIATNARKKVNKKQKATGSPWRGSPAKTEVRRGQEHLQKGLAERDGSLSGNTDTGVNTVDGAALGVRMECGRVGGSREAEAGGTGGLRCTDMENQKDFGRRRPDKKQRAQRT